MPAIVSPAARTDKRPAQRRAAVIAWVTLTPKLQHAGYRKGLCLLQITSHEDMSFGRYACGAFCIRVQDLKARRFDRVWYGD